MEEIKKQPFICPYCKQSEGFRSEKPVRGKDVLYFDEFGESIDGDMLYTTQYKEKREDKIIKYRQVKVKNIVKKYALICR